MNFVLEVERNTKIPSSSIHRFYLASNLFDCLARHRKKHAVVLTRFGPLVCVFYVQIRLTQHQSCSSLFQYVIQKLIISLFTVLKLKFSELLLFLGSFSFRLKLINFLFLLGCQLSILLHLGLELRNSIHVFFVGLIFLSELCLQLCDCFIFVLNHLLDSHWYLSLYGL